MASPVTPQDPAGLLNRITELRLLCSDAGVARAVASGNPFKVYRALAWARLTGRLSAHRRTVDQLVRNRRAFARPLKGKVWLGTLNGFGASLVGSAEAEPDGTHIATHSLVALFAVPVFPLGAYVVSREGRSGLSTSWRIYARVPLGGLAWAFSRLVAAGIAVAVLAAAYGAFHSARHRDVHVTNGFPQPLQISIGPASFSVPPGGHDVVNLPVGTHPARATAGGAVVDEGPLEVGMGGDLLVWNVAGAAPVMERQVIYYSGAVPKNATEPEPVLHCGERRISLRGVDHAFSDPPRQISMREGEGRVVRRAVMVGEQKGIDGALLCGFLLLDRKAFPGAAAVMEERARAGGWEVDATRQALWAAAQVGPEAELRVARAAREARPDDVQVNRAYQDVVMSSGGKAQLREEYRKRAEAAPGSSSAQYLHARLLTAAEGLPVVEALVQRFPEDVNLLRLVTGFRCDLGDWPGVDRGWRALRARSPARAGDVLVDEAMALAAQGRQAEALHVIADLFPQLDPDARGMAAVLYARLAQRGGAPDAENLISKLEPGDQPVLRARAGLDPGEPQPSQAVLVLRAAATDPRDALARVIEAGPVGVMGLDSETTMLLYAEAIRSSHPAAKVLETVMRGDPEYLEPFRSFVLGQPGTAAAVHPSLRAAAELVRSRVASLPAAERTALRTAALKDDLLGTVVSRAVKAWPEPGR